VARIAIVAFGVSWGRSVRHSDIAVWVVCGLWGVAGVCFLAAIGLRQALQFATDLTIQTQPAGFQSNRAASGRGASLPDLSEQAIDGYVERRWRRIRDPSQRPCAHEGQQQLARCLHGIVGHIDLGTDRGRAERVLGSRAELVGGGVQGVERGLVSGCQCDGDLSQRSVLSRC
jgi:hypothetical protein